MSSVKKAKEQEKRDFKKRGEKILDLSVEDEDLTEDEPLRIKRHKPL